jgi:hypothetical protein
MVFSLAVDAVRDHGVVRGGSQGETQRQPASASGLRGGLADACVAWTGFPGAFPVYRDDRTAKHHEFSWLMGPTAAILE